MRPDRAIRQCRGEEAFDMLQAMNTGHEGRWPPSTPTPRDAISRLEQMLGMTGMPDRCAADPQPDRQRHRRYVLLGFVDGKRSRSEVDADIHSLNRGHVAPGLRQITDGWQRCVGGRESRGFG